MLPIIAHFHSKLVKVFNFLLLIIIFFTLYYHIIQYLVIIGNYFRYFVIINIFFVPFIIKVCRFLKLVASFFIQGSLCVFCHFNIVTNLFFF
jgi:hypothetical protein